MDMLKAARCIAPEITRVVTMSSHDSPAIRARFATILDDIDFDLCGRMLTFKTASTRLHEPATEFRINPEFLREENIYVPLLKS